MFVRRADYAKIGQTTQKEGETVTEFRTRFEQVFMANSGIPQDAVEDGSYQQQLKNVLLSGMRPEIKEWVTKHFVHLPTSTLPQFRDQVIHAEKVT